MAAPTGAAGKRRQGLGPGATRVGWVGQGHWGAEVSEPGTMEAVH